MSIWPKRKSDAERIEQLRKYVNSRVSRWFRVVDILFSISTLIAIVYLLILWDRLLRDIGGDQSKERLGLMLGISLGIGFGFLVHSSARRLFAAIFGPSSSAERLTVKYHDMLVANGLDPHANQEMNPPID